jgi:hypothetical protein
MGHYHENYPLCADLVISTLGAANYSKPMDSAAFIYGAINSVAAFVAECADYDDKNADSYNKRIFQYGQENKDLLNRAMTIMRAETIRSGHTLEALSKRLLNEIKINAERSEEQRREDPQKFLANCRG